MKCLSSESITDIKSVQQSCFCFLEVQKLVGLFDLHSILQLSTFKNQKIPC